MNEVIIQLTTAFAGSLGFCMMFRLRRGLWFPASVGGFLCWGVYLLGNGFGLGIFAAAFLASAFAAMYAEILARLMKAPATLFLLPAVVPLVPRGALFYTMSYAVEGNLALSGEYGASTVQYALGIACGMCIVWALFTTIRPRKN